jgi:hypothetical protein
VRRVRARCFGKLNAYVSAHDAPAARRLSSALLARGRRRSDALYWAYDFPFGGGAPGWTSGFTQVVAAQALARASVLLGDRSYAAAAAAAFRGLQQTLLMPLGGGSWIREYSFTDQAIRYQLGGSAADVHYQTYHVDLLRRLAARHT